MIIALRDKTSVVLTQSDSAASRSLSVSAALLEHRSCPVFERETNWKPEEGEAPRVAEGEVAGGVTKGERGEGDSAADKETEEKEAEEAARFSGAAEEAREEGVFKTASS